MPSSPNDQYFMNIALALAKKAEGKTLPNPMVGALIVKNNRIISKGFHHGVGLPHAEIEALAKSKESVKGATLFVTLEPCSHFGKTPPCTDAIMKSGIARVVCPVIDPNLKVNGLGIKKLKKAGIDVSLGTCALESKKLNEAFFTYHTKKRPFVALKFASSLDGKLATRTNDSKWITNEKARHFARKLRAKYQAVLVGINTVLRDDPHLGAREKDAKDPLRIILDSKLRIPLYARVLRDSNVLIATTTQASKSKIEALSKKGIEILTFKGRDIPIKKLMHELFKRNIVSVFVEGGGKTLGSFIDEKLADKVFAFYSPLLIGGEKSVFIGGKGAEKVFKALPFKIEEIKKFDDNFLVVGAF